MSVCEKCSSWSGPCIYYTVQNDSGLTDKPHTITPAQLGSFHCRQEHWSHSKPSLTPGPWLPITPVRAATSLFLKHLNKKIPILDTHLDLLLLFPTLKVECLAFGQICFSPEATGPLDDLIWLHDYKYHVHPVEAESEDRYPTAYRTSPLGPCYRLGFPETN